MTPKTSIRFTLTQAYVLGLMMMAVGLTLSPFLMGMSQFWLILVWIVDAIVKRDFKENGTVLSIIRLLFCSSCST